MSSWHFQVRLAFRSETASHRHSPISVYSTPLKCRTDEHNNVSSTFLCQCPHEVSNGSAQVCTFQRDESFWYRDQRGTRATYIDHCFRFALPLLAPSSKAPSVCPMPTSTPDPHCEGSMGVSSRPPLLAVACFFFWRVAALFSFDAIRFLSCCTRKRAASSKCCSRRLTNRGQGHGVVRLYLALNLQLPSALLMLEHLNNDKTWNKKIEKINQIVALHQSCWNFEALKPGSHWSRRGDHVCDQSSTNINEFIHRWLSIMNSWSSKLSQVQLPTNVINSAMVSHIFNLLSAHPRICDLNVKPCYHWLWRDWTRNTIEPKCTYSWSSTCSTLGSSCSWNGTPCWWNASTTRSWTSRNITIACWFFIVHLSLYRVTVSSLIAIDSGGMFVNIKIFWKVMSSGRKSVQPWLCIGSCMSHHQLSMCTSTPQYSESSLSLKLYLHSFLLRAYETVYESDKEIYGEPDIVNNPIDRHARLGGLLVLHGLGTDLFVST